MILKDVAKKLICAKVLWAVSAAASRVTSEKLMLTPRGIFEMKILKTIEVELVM